jgi:D-glycero-D-manno-heptose 1,7-bisphosphate phosphatase
VKAVFLDRDGVICRNRDGHIKSWGEFEFLPRAREAIARLTDAGLPVVVVTNQAVINRGLAPTRAVEDIHRCMKSEVEAYGGRIARVYHCPHRPDERCGCRKPQPGMLLQAARELGIDLETSYLIGDAVTDVQAAQAVGATAYMVLTGRGKRQYLSALGQGMNGFIVTLDLWQAVDDILRRELGQATQSDPSVAQREVIGL